MTSEQSFSDASVHRMCGYLRGDYKCERCPRRTQTPYGEGMHGCYALAEETLAVAKEAGLYAPGLPDGADARIAELEKALRGILSYFRSGNSIPVERATIKADAPEIIFAKSVL